MLDPRLFIVLNSFTLSVTVAVCSKCVMLWSNCVQLVYWYSVLTLFDGLILKHTWHNYKLIIMIICTFYNLCFCSIFIGRQHSLLCRALYQVTFGISRKPTRDSILLHNDAGQWPVSKGHGQWKHWKLLFLTTPLSFDVPSPENHNEHLHKPYRARN